MYFDSIIAGFGGQGVLFIGNLLAYAAMAEGHNVTYMPVYGVEMRGGTANCTVVISDQDIGSPAVLHPVSAIVMNKPSLAKFGPLVKKGGALVINGSMIKPSEIRVKGPDKLVVPTLELAVEAGNERLASMVALGALVQKTGVATIEALSHSLKENLDKRYHKMIPANVKALKRGAEFARNGK